jgi:hypothetical protein
VPRTARRTPRRGSVLPLIVVSLTALLGFVALAVDLGLIAIARTQAQNAADCAALTGARTLSGDPLNNNNYANCEPAARIAAGANKVLTNYINGQDPAVVQVQVGAYSYNPASGVWSAMIPKGASDPYSLVRVTINATGNQTFFARVFGVNMFNVTARATAAHRPRDIAMILDFSGSMRFSSVLGIPRTNPRNNGSASGSGSNNPESVYPTFGHYSDVSAAGLRFTADALLGGDQYTPSNVTVADPVNDSRPPIVDDFYQDPPFTEPNVRAFHNPAGSPQIPADGSLNADNLAGGDEPLRQGHLLNLGNLLGAPYAKTLQEVFGLTIAVDRPGFLNSGYDYPPLGRPAFQGYTRGPRYWGKTFFIWPPDPRPAKDWRKKFFLNGDGTPLVDHTRLWESNGTWKIPSSSTYRINYEAILDWIKNTGPNPFPPQLRAGHIKYYGSIPDTINTGSFPPSNPDQRFWKEYIDHCLGLRQTSSSNWVDVTGESGYGEDFAWGGASIVTTNDNNPTSPNYRLNNGDHPRRPRTKFWFGPMTMVDFLGTFNDPDPAGRHWWPGTCHEAPMYACKLGIRAALTDAQNNHPNDAISLIFFSFPKNSAGDTTAMAGPPRFNSVRAPLGRNYPLMQSSLWFPPSTLNADGSNNGTESTPYDAANAEVPRASGATCYSMGLMLAYNQFQYTSTTDTVLRKWAPPSATVPEGLAGGMGRKGAQKMVIFMTDGAPNIRATANLQTAGSVKYYNIRHNPANPGGSQYPSTSYTGDNNSTVLSEIYGIIDQMKIAYSTPRKPIRLHTICFGPVFESGSANQAACLSTLQNMQYRGNTQSSPATPLDAFKIVTGPDSQMVSKLQTAISRLMQGSLQIVLLE